jgi:hypothetical protein
MIGFGILVGVLAGGCGDPDAKTNPTSLPPPTQFDKSKGPSAPMDPLGGKREKDAAKNNSKMG